MLGARSTVPRSLLRCRALMCSPPRLQADMVSKLNAELEAAGEKRRALEAQVGGTSALLAVTAAKAVVALLSDHFSCWC